MKRILSLYKNMDDDELVKFINIKIDKMKEYLETEDMNKYWELAEQVNSMIVEVKNRDIKIDEKDLIKKILKK